MKSQCALCGHVFGSVFARGEQRHLHEAHPTKDDIYNVYFFGARRFFTNAATMTIAEMMVASGTGEMDRQHFVETPDGLKDLSHGEAVDLSVRPHIWQHIPATTQ